MSEVSNCIKSMRANDLIVCVNSYENKRMEGNLLTNESSSLGHFDNVVQLLHLIQSTLDQLGYPEPYTLIKNFSTRGDTAKTDTIDFTAGNVAVCSGRLATFYIKIIFRQNASWQGVITWIENRKEESFRSALELIFLMDSALSIKR